MNDLDKVLKELNESGPEIGGGLPTHAEMDNYRKNKNAVAPNADGTYDSAMNELGKKLTPEQVEIVRNAIAGLPANISPQVKTLFGQAARWMTFEELLKAMVEIITTGNTKVIGATDVPALNKSLAMKARKVNEE